MPRISTRQIKAARILLGWSQADLARAADISASTIHRFEHGRGFNANTYFKIVGAMEDHGIEFIPADGTRGEGLRLTKPTL
ncbi:MAG: hypothetical protein RLY86_2519 [Pseudomonadota bacterium]|jgi:transcriptional regulator with XRE-family HTH domain